VRVRFRKPILLPSKVTFGSAEEDGGSVRFSVRGKKPNAAQPAEPAAGAKPGSPHLDGWVETDRKEAS
jgi:hypothetical protein